MNLFKEDKTIVMRWLTFSCFFLFFGYGMGYIQPFEKRMENLIVVSVIFALGSGLGVVALSGLRVEDDNE
jgi:hypothetical protein